MKNSIIPKPCHKSWSELGADEILINGEQKIESTARYCIQCERHVHDITDMSKAEISTLKAELGGKLCGMICSDEKKKPAPKANLNLTMPLMVGTSVASLASLALASCTPQATMPTPSHGPKILGKVATPTNEAGEPHPFPTGRKSATNHHEDHPAMWIGVVAEE